MGLQSKKRESARLARVGLKHVVDSLESHIAVLPTLNNRRWMASYGPRPKGTQTTAICVHHYLSAERRRECGKVQATWRIIGTCDGFSPT